MATRWIGRLPRQQRQICGHQKVWTFVCQHRRGRGVQQVLFLLDQQVNCSTKTLTRIQRRINSNNLPNWRVNRPMLVLKSEQGFVGYKNGSSCKLECNKANYEAIQVERGPLGLVYFKGKWITEMSLWHSFTVLSLLGIGQSGRYWQINSDGITADGDTPEGFYLELREPSKLCIKSGDGAYLMADKNGVFTAGSRDSAMATRWEF